MAALGHPSQVNRENLGCLQHRSTKGSPHGSLWMAPIWEDATRTRARAQLAAHMCPPHTCVPCTHTHTRTQAQHMHLWHAHVCASQPTCVHLAQSCTHAHACTRLCAHAPRARPCCVHAAPSCRHVARRVLLAAALRPQPPLSPGPRPFPLLRGSAPGWLALFQGLDSMGGRPFRGSEAWEMFIARPRRGWRAAIWERHRARAAQHSQTSGSKGQSGEGGQGGEEKPLLANTQRRKPCLSQPQIPSVVLSQSATSGFLILRTSEGSQMSPGRAGVATEQRTTPPGCTSRCASSEVLLVALLDPNPRHPGAVGRRSQSLQTPGEGLQCGRLEENLSCPPPYEDGGTGGTPWTRGAGGGWGGRGGGPGRLPRPAVGRPASSDKGTWPYSQFSARWRASAHPSAGLLRAAIFLSFSNFVTAPPFFLP